MSDSGLHLLSRIAASWITCRWPAGSLLHTILANQSKAVADAELQSLYASCYA